MEKAKPTRSKGLETKESPIQTFLAILWLPLPIGFRWLKVSIAPFILTVWTVAAYLAVALANTFGISVFGGSLPLACWLPAIASLLPLYVNKRKALKIARATNVDPNTLYFQGGPYDHRYSILQTYARVAWYIVLATALATLRVWRNQVATLSHSQLFEDSVLTFGQLVVPWLLAVVVTMVVLLFLEWLPITHWLLLETTVVAYLAVSLWLVLIVAIFGWYGYASCSEWWFRLTGNCLPRY